MLMFHSYVSLITSIVYCDIISLFITDNIISYCLYICLITSIVIVHCDIIYIDIKTIVYRDEFCCASLDHPGITAAESQARRGRVSLNHEKC